MRPACCRRLDFGEPNPGLVVFENALLELYGQTLAAPFTVDALYDVFFPNEGVTDN